MSAYQLIQLINFNQGIVMSQSAQEKSNLKQVQKSEQKKQEPPIVGVSPNDPIGIDPEETSKPPAPQE